MPTYTMRIDSITAELREGETIKHVTIGLSVLRDTEPIGIANSSFYIDQLGAEIRADLEMKVRVIVHDDYLELERTIENEKLLAIRTVIEEWSLELP